MKIKLSLFVLAFFAVTKLYGQVSDNCVANVLLTSYSEREYISEPVTDQQLDIILKCGIKAPSGMNKQPWKFTVVKDEATMKDAISSIVPGNVIIIVSGAESQDGTTTPDLFAC
jgi:nitroreductase